MRDKGKFCSVNLKRVELFIEKKKNYKKIFVGLNGLEENLAIK